MIVRAPRFEWQASTSLPDRSIPELTYPFVAASVIIGSFEAFITKVTTALIERGPIRDRHLLSQAHLVITQERQHAVHHRRMNQVMGAAGYVDLPRLTRLVDSEYARIAARRSLRYQAAYCAAFESMGLIHAEYYFTNVRGWPNAESFDEPFVASWAWHYVEEYEHRGAALGLYREIFGSPKLLSYLYRVAVALRVVAHVISLDSKLVASFSKADGQAMNADAHAALMRSHRLHQRGWGRFFMKRFLRTLRPHFRSEISIQWPRVDELLRAWNQQKLWEREA